MSTPYSPFYYRLATPPAQAMPLILDGSTHSRTTSSSSCRSSDSSPDSVQTAFTTPVKSPIRNHGPPLLPKIRPQDQELEQPCPAVKRHRKALSSTSNPPGSMMSLARPSVSRSVVDSPDCVNLLSPGVGNPIFNARTPNSALESPIALSTAQARSASSSSGAHARSTSASSLDGFLLGRYGFPTYRQLPAYIAPLPFSLPPHASTVQGMPEYMRAAATAVAPVAPVAPSQRVSYQEYSLPTELQYHPAASTMSTTTLLDFLTAPNPTPSLVRQINTLMRGDNTHFWWDIRNLRSWADFTLQTIESIPDFPQLLRTEIARTALPTPRYDPGHLQPENESVLHDLCNDFYATKVNSAIKVAQGQPHVCMRAEKPREGRRQPEFISSYQHDHHNQDFYYGDGRGRVVGLVKSFDRWNTGMRVDKPHRQVEYLQGLSHLHRHMREHSCRYGFIVTEIELVCVRAGTTNKPYFGFLELSRPIPIELHGRGELTACLALWYLHMLAKEVPLNGQVGAKMHVGPPGALTRQNCLEKDGWIPAPQVGEKRMAKRIRGWVFPEEPLHRREHGIKKRWHK
ncbi:hypothetical protein L228DRAFT_127556 [Xylona heveae TC161]|uniref:Sialidase n=1 Tax=Xylona heveae (strain CBS 132557 / TC161) TaxID=1328760 RepID=A0A165GRI8_XYLHT|nr:hypothetical protein L228DRAFT_127556 [Xylona heveae TC161]KZF22505.1 hypothetical protein L228DRAFT_127556 [Xylona heveae TC161]